MTDWTSMGRDQFDRRLGTARERRLAARLREQPDTLLPELAEVQLTPRGAKPAPREMFPGEVPLFGDDDQEDEQAAERAKLEMRTEVVDCSGVIGAGGLVYSDADPGL